MNFEARDERSYWKNYGEIFIDQLQQIVARCFRIVT